MLYRSRRMMVWMSLLAFSAVVHALVSWRIGQKIEPLEALPPPEEAVQIIVEKPPEPTLEKPEPPEEQLEFEEELELEPPDILIAPKAVALIESLNYAPQLHSPADLTQREYPLQRLTKYPVTLGL